MKVSKYWNSYNLWKCQNTEIRNIYESQIHNIHNIYESQSRLEIPKNNFQTYRTVRDSLSRSKIKDALDKKI